jgi:hypothetical protein
MRLESVDWKKEMEEICQIDTTREKMRFSKNTFARHNKQIEKVQKEKK